MIDAGRRDGLLGGPLRAEVRDRGPRTGSESAHQHNAADAALAGRLDEVPGPGGHHALERRGRAVHDRDEMDDRPHAAGGRAQRRGVGDVTADELAVHPVEHLGSARRAHHRAHVDTVAYELPHDVTPDEAARAGDEDHRSSTKFCQ